MCNKCKTKKVIRELKNELSNAKTDEDIYHVFNSIEAYFGPQEFTPRCNEGWSTYLTGYNDDDLKNDKKAIEMLLDSLQSKSEKNKNTNEEKHKIFWRIIIPIIVGVVSAVIAALITFFIMKGMGISQ